MKTAITSILILLFIALAPVAGLAQDTTKVEQPDTARQKVVVIKNDGTEYIGYIIKQDEREILLETENLGRLYIPKHEIKSITELTGAEIVGREYLGDPIFGTRYFVTTNGYTGKKGDHYVIWNWWGPDVQFSLSDHVTVGVLTTWVGMPLIASAKYGTNVSDRVAVGGGVLIGTLSWAAPEFGLGAAYGSLTFGKMSNNFSFSGGYGAITGSGNEFSDKEWSSAFLFSVGSHQQLTKKFSFIFDSFLIFDNQSVSGIITPGFRILQNPGRAVQFGFTGFMSDGELFPIPMPVVGWMRTF